MLLLSDSVQQQGFVEYFNALPEVCRLNKILQNDAIRNMFVKGTFYAQL